MPRRKVDKSDLPQAGTAARAKADAIRYVSRPDEPMVPHGVAGSIANTRGMDVPPSKLFEDGGRKLDVVRAILDIGRGASMPKTREGLFDSLQAFFAFCADNSVPTTIGLFACWNGVSVNRMAQIERDKSDPRSEAVSVCKDMIRNFLELAAIDSAINPIVYFHMNKVYYGAVENQVIQLRTEENQVELSSDEYRQRVIQLTQDEDGTYRAPVDTDEG